MLARLQPGPLARRPSLVLLAALLACGAGAAQDDFDWQAADGSFPDHGACTYLGPAGLSAVATAASDHAASKLRTRVTDSVLAMVPPARTAQFVPPSATSAVASEGHCSGIDDCVERAARAAGVRLADIISDVEFLRRVRLDLTGRIPTKQEVLDFAANTRANKRAELVDELLNKPEWADRWAMFFGDHFRNTRRTAQVDRFHWGRDSFHFYLRNSMRANKPYDVMAREMLAAEGTSDGRTYPAVYSSVAQWQQTYQNHKDNPVKPSPVGYVVGARTTGGPIQDTYDTLAYFAARDFLGISVMDCVLCHDGAGHLEPLTVWGAAARRSQGWGLAAFFSQVPRYQRWRVLNKNKPEDPSNPGRKVKTNYYMVRDLGKGEIQRTNKGDTAGVYLGQTTGGNRPDRLSPVKHIQPKYPFESRWPANPNLRLREQVGHHMTSDPQFARAAVNYIWRAFFSRGIVEPPDQFDLARLDPAAPPPAGWDIQPSHPRLLQWLANGFAANGFDLKWLMREIATSRAYQRSSRYEGVFNPLNEKYFVRHQAKRLTAEQVIDALMVASNQYRSEFRYSNPRRAVSFAMQLPDITASDMPWGGGRDVRNIRGMLDAFTRGDRDQTPRSSEGSPLQALALMNNGFVNWRVNPANSRDGTLSQALAMASDEALVEHLYLSVLSRWPSPQEVETAVRYLQAGADRANRASDLIWALFNKSDFYFNY